MKHPKNGSHIELYVTDNEIITTMHFEDGTTAHFVSGQDEESKLIVDRKGREWRYRPTWEDLFEPTAN